MVAIAFGGTHPITSNRQKGEKNRRVELIVIPSSAD
jgi:flagellar motor protein MotB